MQSITIVVCALILFYQSALIKTQNLDIVQTAINDGNFNTLVAALTAADLVTTLRGNGPFTVFAPTDTAFAKLPPGTVADLVKPENKGKLSAILTYHVINGRSLTSAQINSMTLPASVQMLEGSSINVTRSGNNLKVNDATVIIANVICTNGIIHAIDTVLIPPAKGSSATNICLNQTIFFILLLTSLLCFLRLK